MSYELQSSAEPVHDREQPPRTRGHVELPKRWTPSERQFLLAMGCPESNEPTDYHQIYLKFLKFRMQPVLEELRPLLADASDEDMSLMDQGFCLLACIAEECIQQTNFDIDSAVRAAAATRPVPLRAPLLKPKILIDQNLLQSAQSLCFYLVGCMLMLYPPKLPDGTSDQISLLAGRSNAKRTTLPIRNSDAALTELIHKFGPLMPTKPRGFEAADTAVASESSDPNFSRQSLYVSLLNASTLAEVGGLSFVWTDCIGSHLHFDEENLTVLLFRLPSFCKALQGPDDNAFSQVLRGYYDEYFEPDQFTASGYLAEVCRSYALLFDNTTNSRNEYTRSLRRYAYVSHNLAVERSESIMESASEDDFEMKPQKLSRIVYTKPTRRIADDFVDPLLDKLCRGAKANPRNSYSKTISFPILSHRLSILQDYILRQDAMSIKMLWRDRRNKLQWSTFWAVVLLGGLGFIFQLAQTGLSAAQVYYTKYPPKA